MTAADIVVGHYSLKGSEFDYGLHRCELGMGLERPYWRLGLGTRLLSRAVQEAQNTETVDWLDLRVLSSNEPARRLYLINGFTEVNRTPDFCRIEGQSIADFLMSLYVGR